jgi:hypothetical protein
MKKTTACETIYCKYGDECNFAHSLETWVCPEGLVCTFGSSCRNEECYRLHENTLEDKRRVATYKNMKFKKPYVKATTQYVKHKAQARPVPVPVPVKVVKEEVKEEVEVDLLRMKEDLQKEYEVAKQQMNRIQEKIRAFKEIASGFWEAGSKELDF